VIGLPTFFAARFSLRRSLRVFCAGFFGVCFGFDASLLRTTSSQRRG
jgi:hypothetical protein